MSKMVKASLFKNWRSTLERIDKYISPVYFTDCNLRSRLYPKSLILEDVFYAPGEIPFPEENKLCPSQRPSFEHVIQLEFLEKVGLGKSFGPTWSTHWLKVNVNIPDEWLGLEVRLRFNAGCEALIMSHDGRPLQGLSGGISHQLRTDYIISKIIEPIHQKCTYYMEIACNTLFGAGKDSMIAPPDPDKTYSITMLEIAVFDRQVYDLLMDLEVLHDFAKHLGQDKSRAFDALYLANQMINTLVLDNKDSYKKAHEMALAFFSKQNGDSQHTVMVLGNCHIDTAWLWPYGETIRKCARSWSSTLRLFECYGELDFACSQAQQLFWVKEVYPTLFKEMQERAKHNQLRPVGGTWVEMDGNIPSGESFLRQFLYGQAFFQKEFGEICHELWLPDTFGYSAQLPQIMKYCEANYFLSQKMSWNLVNTFPHNSFIWEGIDGTDVLVHFPPANTYSSDLSVGDVINTVTNLKDKGRVTRSLLLYGFGDGGGGPHEDMLERQIRLDDVDGCPVVRSISSEEFFKLLDLESSNMNRWTGELYLELHNGTYTTQAMTKLWNRKCEFHLHNVDFLSALWAMYADIEGAHKEEHEARKAELEAAWKKLLLNQFHDVLPGSAIKAVYDEAAILYQEIQDSVNKIQSLLLSALFGEGDTGLNTPDSEVILVNTLPWQRTEVVKVCDKPASSDKAQLVPVQVSVPSYGFTKVKNITRTPAVVIDQLTDGCFMMKNEHIRAEIDSFGRVKSLQIIGCNNEAIASGCLGNNFILYDDIPLYWDAWDVMDYHLETGKPVLEVKSLASLSSTKDEIVVEMDVGSQSSIHLVITLLPGKPYLTFKAKVNWRENHKFLKVEFPVNVHSSEATYDIQFGHLKRNTHFNTSWDWAKYEVCGHKWVDLSEFDWGVALLNDSKYGHAVHKNVMRMSLLRSPKSPDDQADMGMHEINYALMPHRGTFQQAGVIKEAYSFNVPLMMHYSNSSASALIANDLDIASFFLIENIESGIVIETVKFAHEMKRAIIVRMYEAFGGKCKSKLICMLPFNPTQVGICSGLERIIENLDWMVNGVELTFRPFQIISVLIQW